MKLSIQKLLLISQLSLAGFITLVFGILLFSTNMNAVRDSIVSNVETISKPLASIAERGVGGGNLMKLRGGDAQAIYESSNALAIYIKGISNGSPETDYTAAIPPQPIEYTYYRSSSPFGQEELDRLREAGAGFNEDLGVYIFKQPLDIRNQGELVAVFPAVAMKTITSTVLVRILPVLLVILGIAAVVSYLIGRRLVRPIVEISSIVVSMEKSLDLTVRFPESKIEELADASNALNHFVEHLQSLLQSVSTHQHEISEANTQVAQIVNKSERELDDQKQKLDLLVSAITQMSAAINEVAENAAHNADDARESERLVKEGQSQVESTVDIASEMETRLHATSGTLNELFNATEEIGSVLSVIVGIAEQTNLLALNAAIEAARAGEQGRGFAVVADEVRTLAVRTQESTGEVSNIIQRLQSYSRESVDEMKQELSRVEDTVQRIKRADSALRDILDRVRNITSMTQQIAVSAEQQSKVSDDIDRNIHGLSELSEYALANASETRASVAGVDTQLRTIADQIKRLKLN